jgi:hypothetical protein
MQNDRIYASSRVGEADWLNARLLPFGSGVASIVPDGFSAYVRILHPAYGPGGEVLRWQDVAATFDRTMHRLAQFHAISSPKADAPTGAVNRPDVGNLQPHLLRTLCAILRRHTIAASTCWFCLWSGYGWLHDSTQPDAVFTRADELSPSFAPSADALPSALRAAVRNGARVHLPQRDYLLLEGPLEAAMHIGWTLGGERFIPQSPNLFWPSDHAWCVASEIDLFCTIVGGSNELAEDLLAEGQLEAWRVFADDPVHADSDEINK